MLAKKIDSLKVISYLAAVFNPVPTGLVAAYLLWRDKKYKETAKYVLIISIAVILLAIIFGRGYW